MHAAPKRRDPDSVPLTTIPPQVLVDDGVKFYAGYTLAPRPDVCFFMRETSDPAPDGITYFVLASGGLTRRPIAH